MLRAAKSALVPMGACEFMDSGDESRVFRWTASWLRLLTCLILASVFIVAKPAHSNEQLEQAEALLLGAGYRHATVVQATHPRLGHRTVFAFVDPLGKSAEERKGSALTIFQSVVGLVDSVPLSLIAIKASKRAKIGKYGAYDYLFWKDADGGWRLINVGLDDYLSMKIATTTASTSPATLAHLHWSLAVIRKKRNQISTAAAHFETASTLMQTAESDPNFTRIRSLFGLVRLYADNREQQDFKLALRRYALALGEQNVSLSDYKPLFKQAPRYPGRALSRGVEGQVVVEFTVTEEGLVEDVSIVEEYPSGFGFGTSAVAAAKEFVYIPRIADGELMTTEGVRNKMTFEVE